MDRCEASHVDVTASALDTPIGPLLVAGTDAGIVRVGFLERKKDSELFDGTRVILHVAIDVSQALEDSPASGVDLFGPKVFRFVGRQCAEVA